eukprot:m.132801 g.132801  ORF g.132801 m.132801 type:complete len:61 (-) comp17510_c0_seq12:275-457(-)
METQDESAYKKERRAHTADVHRHIGVRQCVSLRWVCVFVCSDKTAVSAELKWSACDGDDD